MLVAEASAQTALPPVLSRSAVMAACKPGSSHRSDEATSCLSLLCTSCLSLLCTSCLSLLCTSCLSQRGYSQPGSHRRDQWAGQSSPMGTQ
jgi:hypothetical protein